MPKPHIQKSVGVLVSTFAHLGHITREEAQEMSGLDDATFAEAYDKAKGVAQSVKECDTDKEKTFYDKLYNELNSYLKEYPFFV